MADLDIQVKYSYLPARIVFTGMAVMMPLWAVLFPILAVFCAYVLVMQWGRGGSMSGTNFSLWTGMLFWSVSCGVVTLMSGDRRIILNQSGISLPFFLSPCIGFRRSLHWSDVDDVRLSDGSNGKHLLLSAGQKKINISLKNMADSDAEKMLLAVQLWAEEPSKDVSILTLRDESQQAGKELTYTAMWEDELARRFTSTGFIPLEPGTTLRNGSLHVVRQLFFGGLSALYLCQRDGKDLVVLKEAVLPHIQDAEVKAKAEQMFAREAAFLTRLNHPSLVKVLDHFSDSGRNYLLLEYVNGQDLRQLVLQHGKQDQSRVLRWAEQIANILDYLHKQDPPVLHRDLTPDNLVLAPTGELVLIDFGAANEFIGNATGTLVGKQSFIAPEQFRGKACPQSDLYALGCTLYFLLTGKEAMALSTSHPKDAVDTLDSEVDELVAALTELDLNRRIPSAAAALEKIFAIEKRLV